ncbi:CheR family methyltransferase [Blastopirellula marina]|uniref:protein-glutamate O-methyltransferase n=1 Tax=Blastopirellula marina TaxID=124 RepID=A0A2S8FPR1_9BACT|nr:protein-glutamate O-methyltransferase CheR [Blastopirellula marina]PQO33844.1 chemotaxis protein CheR [Blastopirellula marina]PTL43631.1 protein-glutamate O-methyltransferase CheR [Blastopirellula marina]
MSLTTGDIDAVCDLVNDLCGICLDSSKSYLIESRLGQIVEKHGCQNYSELVRKVRLGVDHQLTNQFVDAITTNETLFFRDNYLFEAFRHKALPELIDARERTAFPKRVRIWSAACSTGQEPYSLAMTISELIPDVQHWDIQITATDISDAAIAKASRGVYAKHEIERGVSPERLQRFFYPEGTGWRIRDEIRTMVSFGRKNLMEPLGQTSRYDMVFCRNVAIYFTREVRQDLFRRIAQTMVSDGYLFVGAQEFLADVGPNFTPHQHCRGTFYRPNLNAPVPHALVR